MKNKPKGSDLLVTDPKIFENTPPTSYAFFELL
jgi:hypothetical protein